MTTALENILNESGTRLAVYWNECKIGRRLAVTVNDAVGETKESTKAGQRTRVQLQHDISAVSVDMLCLSFVCLTGMTRWTGSMMIIPWRTTMTGQLASSSISRAWRFLGGNLWTNSLRDDRTDGSLTKFEQRLNDSRRFWLPLGLSACSIAGGPVRSHREAIAKPLRSHHEATRERPFVQTHDPNPGLRVSSS